jgi:hypothetical protein
LEGVSFELGRSGTVARVLSDNAHYRTGSDERN